MFLYYVHMFELLKSLPGEVFVFAMVFSLEFFTNVFLVSGVFDVKTDEIKLLSVMEGDSVTLNTDVTEVQKNDHILWMFQINNSDTRIAEIHKQIIDMYDSNEIFRDRLQMDSRTGSLTIRNTRSEHTGLYKLTIIKGGVTYRSFSVAVYGKINIVRINA